MAFLYRIKPRDKKSVEAFYDVYSKDDDGNIRGFTITETYRWGQGFVEELHDLPHSDDTEFTIDPSIGWGSELEDLCSCYFEFDDTFTDEEKAEIEQAWEDGGPGWLFDGDHDWQIEYDSVTIHGPYVVDKIDEEVYNVSIESVALTPRPPFDGTVAWPFSTAKKED